ncbi:hypothetical protein HIM_05941 [Hirsutella minnesotensis 3608]|uniref:Metallo-beta-lactamase domain-containing protein n=1 Tax=Hirsutella minnesotensis 3608 TaxID=1043627 RepID=A0A0F7ZJP3_9HYPO|nr:hypothetical protein HIM_05941 [Hirsutella minnesotensis 3608]
MDSSEALATASTSTSSTYEMTVAKVQGRLSMPEEAESKPHYVLKRGSVVKFRNPYPSYSNSNGPRSIFRNVVWPVITGELKQPDTTSHSLPVTEPQWLPSRTSSDKLRATWLGHACYYVEFPSGLRVLFDPVFEDRCSPFSFLGPKRYTRQPCAVHDMPVVDAVVISHSHYDHLSRTSVLEIQRKHPDVHFFVGLGLEKWFRGCGLRNVTELDWWEDVDLTIAPKTADDQATSTATPSPGPDAAEKRRRGGGGARKKSAIGALRGPFDLGLIPIGAYHPRAAFSAVHAGPGDAVDMMRDTRCRRALAMHWATWALTLEDVDEPPRLLREALRRRGLPEEGVFDVCEIGASREF